ncbi:HpcH/HpaI aldolase/citrate lyase family protein [Streptomyces sp. NPDC052042]|uniref:HpcH/HpaI aldolase/citrate lyase family protein n=1 Tax=Streptomyces sp. NPDC052042 TaxID=3365683 RepID=UPI0037D3B2D0
MRNTRDTAGFAARLRAANPGPSMLRGLWLTFLGPFGLEVSATAAVQWIGVDLQHGDLTEADVVPLLRASRVPVLVRLASHDPAGLARVLDSGADGVIVPAVESAAEAEALVRAAYPPPRGRRSTGLSRAGAVGSGTQPLLLPMIETAAGLDAVDAIAATEGVDGLFVGPYDLALSLGASSVTADPVLAAVRHVAATVGRHGRLTGVFAGDAGLAARLPPVDLLAVDTDAGALRAGLAALFGDTAPPP